MGLVSPRFQKMYECLSNTRHSSAISKETTVALRVIWLQTAPHPATLVAHRMILGRFPARANRELAWRLARRGTLLIPSRLASPRLHTDRVRGTDPLAV